LVVKLGLIGCGGISRAHINAYRSLADRVKVVAVADIVESRAKSAAEATGAEAYYLDYRKILERRDIDAVDMCLPHDLHAKVTVEAAEAGKHVLCEKPIARTLREADQMIEAAKRNNVKLMIAENYRFIPEVEAARVLINQGVIGKVFLGKTDFSAFPEDLAQSGWKLYAERVGGGVVIDSGIHYVDLMRWLLGEVEAVVAFTNHLIRLEITGEDTGCILFRHRSGAISVLALTWAVRHTGEEFLFKVYGSEGTLACSTCLTLYKEGGARRIEVKSRDSFTAEIEHFINCVEKDETPLVTGEEARRDLELVLATYEAAVKGCAVRV
jgi:predicted dehydrogenase